MFLYKQPVAVRGKVKFEMEFWELQEDMADQLHIPCLEAPPPPQKKFIRHCLQVSSHEPLDFVKVTREGDKEKEEVWKR